MNGLEVDGIPKLIVDTIMKCPQDLHKELFASIVVSGGVSMLKGFPERIEKEITIRAPINTKIKIIAQPDRKYAAWNGGSIFACLSAFPQKEYKDAGPGINNS